MFDHVPDRIPVDSEVVVDEDVSHPDDVRPWDAGICGSEFRRDPPYGFPDDLEVVNDPDLCHFVVVKVLTAPNRYLLNPLNRFENIQYPFKDRLS